CQSRSGTFVGAGVPASPVQEHSSGRASLPAPFRDIRRGGRPYQPRSGTFVGAGVPASPVQGYL
ncbi:MAG: hypothetical protein NZT92_00660, partial [Abditibacteriales bacterium]|nr:hypothetical protein [Abditibacteriales bacterium]